MPNRKVAKQKSLKPKVAVETITVVVPITGKPFKSFQDVIHAYHDLPKETRDFLSGSSKLRELESSDLLQLLVFLHRIGTWDSTAALKDLAEKVKAELGKPASPNSGL